MIRLPRKKGLLPAILLTALSVPMLQWVSNLWWEFYQLVNYGHFSVQPDWGMTHGELVFMPLVMAAFVVCLVWLFWDVRRIQFPAP